jgi:hypothetical protein
MEDRVPNLLMNIAKWLFGCAGVVFLVGMGWLYIEAPCSNTGAYIVFTAVGMGVAAFCCLSIRSLLVRTRDSLLLAGVIAFYTAIMFFVGSGSALLLCRGV